MSLESTIRGVLTNKQAPQEITEAKHQDPGEYDQEGDMAKTQLRGVMKDAEHMIKMFGNNDNLPEWVQAKIIKAADYLKSAHNYMMNKDEEVKEEWVCGKCNCEPCTCENNLEEKTLTPAELKKREEIAKAIERENPDMPMPQKMAIATAQAKKTAEAYDEPQGQAKRMMSPLQKARMDKEKADRDREGKLKPGVTKEDFQLDEGNMMSAAKELEAYARKSGGIDKNDFMKAAMMMKRNQKKQLDKFVDELDTEPREKILSVMQKHIKEEVELDEAMNASSIEKAMRKALKDRGNYKNGKVNWNFIDADTYMEVKPGRAQVKQFYRIFDQIASKLTKEMNLKEDISEAKKVTSMQIHKVLANTKNSREGIAALKKTFRVNDIEAKKMLNQVMNEETIDEISRSMTPMRNRFGGTVDPKKFDAYKKHMKTHKLDEPTVRMIHQNPDDAESKRMMKNPKYAQAVSLYKASMKKESVDESAEAAIQRHTQGVQNARDDMSKAKGHDDMVKAMNKLQFHQKALKKAHAATQTESTFVSKFKEELKEKKRGMSETKGAPKGYHFTRSGQLKKGDAGQDGPGGKMLRSDPLDKQRKKIPPLPENDK